MVSLLSHSTFYSLYDHPFLQVFHDQSWNVVVPPGVVAVNAAIGNLEIETDVSTLEHPRNYSVPNDCSFPRSSNSAAAVAEVFADNSTAVRPNDGPAPLFVVTETIPEFPNYLLDLALRFVKRSFHLVLLTGLHGIKSFRTSIFEIIVLSGLRHHTRSTRPLYR
jgi:hypothetical protein